MLNICLIYYIHIISFLSPRNNFLISWPRGNFSTYNWISIYLYSFCHINNFSYENLNGKRIVFKEVFEPNRLNRKGKNEIQYRVCTIRTCRQKFWYQSYISCKCIVGIFYKSKVDIDDTYFYLILYKKST